MRKQAEEHSLESMSDLEGRDMDLGAAHQLQKLPLPSPDASPSQNTGKTSSATQDTYMSAIESPDMRSEQHCSPATALPEHTTVTHTIPGLPC